MITLTPNNNKDFLNKMFDREDVAEIIGKYIEVNQLTLENEKYKRGVESGAYGDTTFWNNTINKNEEVIQNLKTWFETMGFNFEEKLDSLPRIFR